MFYALSKIGWFFATPSNLLTILILLGLVLARLGRRRSGGGLAALALAGLVAAGLGPLGNWLILPLEQRFPIVRDGAPAPTGIIVLGGAVEDRVAAARGGFIELNEAGDRILALVALARRYPQARLVFTGGTGAFIGASDVPEAEIVRRRLDDLGIDPARIVFETASRNTAENATLTAAIVAPKPGETWWLLTSAFHMPRSVGVFRRAGFAVTAYPVDFRTAGPGDAERIFATMGEGLRRTDLAAKEWLGLLAYWVTGRTDALFPGP